MSDNQQKRNKRNKEEVTMEDNDLPEFFVAARKELREARKGNYKGTHAEWRCLVWEKTL